ncbi:hypothetical protein LSTR_LSTR010742 [Laodelphax striatellus]|uniref:Vesicle-associated membrane protein 7 n=1 Tax=Laodelphax striatellus TaxID=195883 RepID=A0A482XRN0_LAOST|nr:hypothetical protein LSTR_LSTR010742 [Laodelphax striatellus]
MPILYSVVARGTTVLAKFATCAGNFSEVTEQILAKIAPENRKKTLSHSSYLFHYICEDRIVYMCIADDEFERSRAFLYLNEIKKRFRSTYGSRADTAIAYAMNSEFGPILGNEMAQHINLDNIAMRGERLELLVDKTENLTASSVTFRATSRNLQRALFWKNMKLYMIISAIVLVSQQM